MLPEDAPEPYGDFVAAVDCAALPPHAVGLPLPSDGQLLFFAVPDVLSDGVRPGLVFYVPAGTPAVRRTAGPDACPPYESRQLRTLWHQLSWPDGPSGYEDEGGPLEDNFQLLGELEAAWSHVAGWRPGWRLHIGGHPNLHNWNPVETAREEAPADNDSAGNGADDASDWTLLATWECGDDVRELNFGLVHWVIRRRDLTALRFDRVYLYVDLM
jgi:hypothetical protein